VLVFVLVLVLMLVLLGCVVCVRERRSSCSPSGHPGQSNEHVMSTPLSKYLEPSLSLPIQWTAIDTVTPNIDSRHHISFSVLPVSSHTVSTARQRNPPPSVHVQDEVGSISTVPNQTNQPSNHEPSVDRQNTGQRCELRGHSGMGTQRLAERQLTAERSFVAARVPRGVCPTKIDPDRARIVVGKDLVLKAR
jgi:hypothetical protein